jgi:DNA-binding response OmpR family regulator
MNDMEDLQIEKDLLIVEDDLDFASLLLKKIEKLGLVVDIATSVEEAKGFLASDHYKLVSLDVFLGHDNCAPLIKEIRTEGHLNQAAQVVVLSAHTNQDFVKRIQSKGIKAFSKKKELEHYLEFLKTELSSLEKQEAQEEAMEVMEDLPLDLGELDLAA